MKPTHPECEAGSTVLRSTGIPEEAVIWGWVVCSEEQGLYYCERPLISMGFICKDIGTTSLEYEARVFRKRDEATALCQILPGYEVQLMIEVELDVTAVIRESEIKGYQQLEEIV